jgi:(E)-4-hydroxy-3-methyl-but-2-enyl pyrophosphate reductase
MRVLLATRYAGFCGGVKRAWELALREAAQSAGPVYLSGELIHNAPAMRELQERGLRIVKVTEGDSPTTGTLIMRAHGEGPRTYARARELGLRIVDATCGIVKAVQRRAEQLEQQGFQVILVGHKKHPEALATVAHTKRGLIIESPDEAEQLPHFEKIAAIAQTTVLASDFEAVSAVLKRKCDYFEDQGRICGWTVKAQEEAVELAQRVQAMVVVGGKNSSNTKMLARVCGELVPTYHIETMDELRAGWFDGVTTVGVTAGASTRDQDIHAVVEWLRRHGEPVGQLGELEEVGEPDEEFHARIMAGAAGGLIANAAERATHIPVGLRRGSRPGGPGMTQG